MFSSHQRDELIRDREELREIVKRGGRAAYQQEADGETPFDAGTDEAETAGLPGDLRRAAFHQELAAREIIDTRLA